jgi:nucleotide-binding universal stress UspA family protein
MAFKNILVPYDDSECSLHAFKIAAEIAKKFNSKLTVLTVIPKSYHTSGFYANVKFDEILLKQQRDSANSALSKADSIAKKQGIKLVKYVLESNSVVKTLVTFSKSGKFDLIVMGTHGRTGWSKLIIGSVANGIIQTAHCPALVVR